MHAFFRNIAFNRDKKKCDFISLFLNTLTAIPVVQELQIQINKKVLIFFIYFLLHRCHRIKQF